ncbi:Leucine-rich repeat receptor protein kinase [Spatholobus suberectus]|nr:Leucine-rich repeat receptor protein kinase [Spatholobus suberectus]
MFHEPRLRRPGGLQNRFRRVPKSRNMEQQHEPVFLERRVVHSRPSLAARSRKPRPPRFHSRLNFPHSPPSSESQREPFLRFCSQPLQPHFPEASLPVSQPVLRRVPATVTSLFHLYRLDLSNNNFSGEIPATLTHLTHLLTLRLDGNNFSGHIPDVNLPTLQEFNVSGNGLSGEIPKALSSFPESSFGRNPFLCGAPIKKCSSDPTKPGSEGAIASPLLPQNNHPTTTVSSSPSSMPKTPTSSGKSHEKGASKISPVALIAIIVGDVLVLAVVSLLLFCYFWRNYSAKLKEGKGSKLFESEKIVYSSSPYPAQGGFERGRMVFFEGEKRFELEDLLRASAEMLGKGGFGTAYKAVLDDGNVVAVKRLKDAQITGKREFEQHMEVLGRLRHPNVVSLRAYYFAREEKLLVYDYMPNATLFWLLHGNRGPGRTPLDWTTRLKIAAGAARGVAFIHNSCKSLRLTHGNIKSTNVLLDKHGNARVSDFGLSVFAGRAQWAGDPTATARRRHRTAENSPRSLTCTLSVCSCWSCSRGSAPPWSRVQGVPTVGSWTYRGGSSQW